MRRYAYIILFLLVLVLPFVVRRWIGAAPREERARGRGDAPRLVVLTPHNQDIRREYGRAFRDWYRRQEKAEVEVDFRTPGGTNDIKRLLENTYARHADRTTGKLPESMEVDLHVVWGGGDHYFNSELKKLGTPPMNVLQPLRLSPELIREVFPKPDLGGVRLYDVPREPSQAIYWVGVCLSSFGIVYNPDAYATLGLPEPRTWSDLTHEKLAGWLALADPNYSGSASVAYLMVIQRAMADAEQEFLGSNPRLRKEELAKNSEYQKALARGWKEGMRQLLLIAANARYFSDSATLVPNDVGNGQAAAGMAIDFYGRVVEETVGAQRCRFISPAAATAITPDPVAILHGVKGKQYELAMKFVEFLLSPEGQRLWILKAGEPGGPRERALRRPPIRRDLYPPHSDQKGWADQVDPYRDAGGFNQRGDWMQGFSQTRMIWSAAWIESREALQEAYAAVREVEDPQRRAELIRELADLPVEYGDVLNTKTDSDSRLRWAKKFRGHYLRIEERAMART